MFRQATVNSCRKRTLPDLSRKRRPRSVILPGAAATWRTSDNSPRYVTVGEAQRRVDAQGAATLHNGPIIGWASVLAEMYEMRRSCLESVKQYRRQTERVASECEQRLAADGLAGKGKPPRLARWLGVTE